MMENPMDLTASCADIIRAVSEFAALDRYQGALPRKHALLYDENDLKALTDAGILEKMKFTFSCGRRSEGFRLTSAGREALAGLPETSPDEAGLAPEHIDIMNDIYHFSKITKNKGVMPKDLARRYQRDDLEDLFSRGYILRVKVKGFPREGKSIKGFVLSSKGLRVIREYNRA
jgi:hypothetical protein